MRLSPVFSAVLAPAPSREVRVEWLRAFGLDRLSLSYAEKRDGKVIRSGRIEGGKFLAGLTAEVSPEWVIELGVPREAQAVGDRLLSYPFRGWPALSEPLKKVETALSGVEIGCLAAELDGWRPTPILAHFHRGTCLRLATFPELTDLLQSDLDPMKLKDFFGTQASVLFLQLDPTLPPELRLTTALNQGLRRVDFRLTPQDSL